ncbi:MAG: Ig-like domain-containing protein, partial [Dissulfurispiraceae bacterium]
MRNKNNRANIIPLFVIFFFMASPFLFSCGGHENGTSSTTLVSIAVTPTNPGIALKTTEQFKATGTYSDNSTKDITASVIWGSSATSVATISNTINSSGLATPVAAGTATITATSGSISGSTTLTVSSATLVSIAVTPTNPGIALKTTEQFTATGTFSDQSTQDITASVIWGSSATSVATISNTTGSFGLVTPVAAGTATITATSGSISGSTALTVSSATLVSIAVTPTNPGIALKTTEQFTATGTFS